MLTGQLATSATELSEPGIYAITQRSLGASANYSLTFLPGVLTVEQAGTPERGTPVSSIAAALDMGRLMPTSSSTTAAAVDSRILLADPHFDGPVICFGGDRSCVTQSAQATP